MQALSDIIIAIVNTKINRLSNELRQLLQSAVFSQQSSVIIEQRIDVEERSIKDWTAKKVEFFDSIADDFESVINLRKHVFYRNIYTFVNRLNDVKSLREKDKRRHIISQCLRNTTLIWHFTELFDVEKEIYRDMSFENWCKMLIKRFKKRASAALNYLQFIKYTLQDVRLRKDSRVFAQNLFKHAKVVSLTFVYNQLILAWNNLDWQFKQHISQFTKNTTIQTFLKQLNNNCDIWFELINSNQNFKRFFISKPFYQKISKRNTNRYFNRSLSKHDFAYQNQNRKKFQNVDITIKMKNAKNSSDRDFDKNDRNRYDKNYDRNYDRRNRDRIEFRDNNKAKKDFKNKNKEKTKAYIAQKNIDDNDHSNSDLQYFDFDYDEFYDFEETVKTNHVITLNIFCRRCSSFFSSNNLLHKHIRSKSCEVTFIKKMIKFFHKDFYELTVYVSISKDSFASTV